MIDFYYWPTPNGHKVAIALEEMALPYTTRAVNILQGEQFEPAFLKVSPNNKVPAIRDADGPGGASLDLFESGAILQYLADKTGQFLPAAGAARYETLAWLNFQTASAGPMLGQCGHFMGYAPKKIPYAIERYQGEALRLYGVMEKRLSASKFLGGDEYSIVDMAMWPWIRVRWLQEIEIDDYPSVKAWYEGVEQREGVRRGIALLADEEKIGNPDDETREAFFGQSQVTQRGTS